MGVMPQDIREGIGEIFENSEYLTQKNADGQHRRSEILLNEVSFIVLSK
jgi:hypothetical protein